MKKMLVGLMVLWSVAAIANAAEVVTTVDATYTSKYIWRGFDKLDDVSAWQPSVNFDLGNGFSANAWASYPGSSGTTDTGFSRVNQTEYNYTLAYSGVMNETCPWRTDYKVGYRYYDYIDTGSKELDMQEVFAEFAMPELVGGGIVPRGAIYQMWDSKGGGMNAGSSGTIYAMGFGYGFTLDQAPELPMAFGWDLVYNDGVGLSTVDHDWSHMVWSLSTSMKCPMTGAKITPAVYFQNSFEDTVNTEDELWASLSYAFSF
jgi:hypothetical protein